MTMHTSIPTIATAVPAIWGYAAAFAPEPVHVLEPIADTPEPEPVAEASSEPETLTDKAIADGYTVLAIATSRRAARKLPSDRRMTLEKRELKYPQFAVRIKPEDATALIYVKGIRLVGFAPAAAARKELKAYERTIAKLDADGWRHLDRDDYHRVCALSFPPEVEADAPWSTPESIIRHFPNNVGWRKLVTSPRVSAMPDSGMPNLHDRSVETNIADLLWLRDMAEAAESRARKAHMEADQRRQEYEARMATEEKKRRDGAGEVRAPRAAILDVLKTMSKTVEKRCTIPILANVRITAVDGRLRFIGTDLDMEAVQMVDATIVAGNLDVTIPCHQLLDMAQKAPKDSDIVIRHDGEAVTVFFGRLEVKPSNVLPTDDFPAFNPGELPVAFFLRTTDFRTALAKTSVAISTEETRYYLNGIYMHRKMLDGNGNSELVFVATDGHRLVRYALPDSAVELPVTMSGQYEPGSQGILPRRFIEAVLRALKAKGCPEVAKIELGEAKVRVTIGDLVYMSKLIDGTFPDYSRVIPTQNNKRLRINRKELLLAIDQVSVVASDRGRAVKITIGDGAMVLACNNPDTGCSRLPIVDFTYEGGPLEIGFNAGYLEDLITLIGYDEVEILFADPGSPTRINDPADRQFLAVQMPMRV